MRKSSSYGQDITDSLDEGVRTDAIIIDFSKVFGLVPHNRLLTKIAATRVDLRVVVWVKEFLLGHLRRVRVDGQLRKSEETQSAARECIRSSTIPSLC